MSIALSRALLRLLKRPTKTPPREAENEAAGKKFYHVGCGGLVWAEEWVTSIFATCDKCNKRWDILTPMNDVVDGEGNIRRWLFGPEWCASAKEGA